MNHFDAHTITDFYERRETGWWWSRGWTWQRSEAAGPFETIEEARAEVKRLWPGMVMQEVIKGAGDAL